MLLHRKGYPECNLRDKKAVVSLAEQLAVMHVHKLVSKGPLHHPTAILLGDAPTDRTGRAMRQSPVLWTSRDSVTKRRQRSPCRSTIRQPCMERAPFLVNLPRPPH